MDPTLSYPILRSLFSPFLRSQQKTLAWVVRAILEVAQANSLDIAQRLSWWLRIQVGSALNRFYRLLRNPRIDDWLLTAQLLKLFSGRLLIAIDWTEWHSDLRMLLGSVVAGRRAIPVAAATFNRQDNPRSQNSRENIFVQLLADKLRETGQQAVLLCDRGFRRVSWIAWLLQLRQHFVVRLMANVVVHVDGKQRTLRRWPLQRGETVDLGRVALRQDGKVVARVVGAWAPGQREPWWLATDLDEPLPELVSLYDRRMAIEEQIRDTKGCRFGLKLEWTQFRTPAYLSRFVLLLGAALAVWTAVGAAAVHRDPTLQFSDKKKGARLSLPRVGATWLERFRTEAHLGVEFIRTYLPPPTLRTFRWLSPTPTRAAA